MREIMPLTEDRVRRLTSEVCQQEQARRLNRDGARAEGDRARAQFASPSVDHMDNAEY